MAGKKREPTFEEGLERLKALVMSLESGQTPLKETFEAYEEGRKLLAALEKQLLEGEKRILSLEEGGATQDITGEIAEAKDGLS